MVIAALFGASRNMDAFLTAFRAPNMLRDLFAEGALSTAFVTTFSRRIATEGDQSAWRLASKVATLTLVFMSALTLLGFFLAPLLVADSRARFRPPRRPPSRSTLTRIMYPVHPPRFARRARHGNAEREECFRRAGDGLELLQSRLDHRRRGVLLVARSAGGLAASALRRARLVGLALGNSARRSPAVAGPVSFRSPRRLSLPIRLQLARPGRAHDPRLDGTGDDRGQRGAGERGGQQRVRLVSAGTARLPG